jgi:predicted PurR-regulated permease PerM
MAEDRQHQVVYRAVLLAGALVVLGMLFRQLATLVLAVLMTVIIAIPLSAFASRLELRGVPRPIGALIGLISGLAAIAGLISLIVPTFVDQAQEFVDAVPGIVDSLRDQAHDITGARPEDVSEEVKDFFQGYTDDPARLIGPLTSIGLSVVGILGALIVILMTAYFMAVKPQPLIEGMLRLFPPYRRDWAMHVMGRLRTAWLGWMTGLAIDMVVSGTLTYIGLTIIGLDYALVFSVITALLVVVPYFGAFVSALPPFLFALADSPGKAFLVLAVYLAVQQLEGNVIIPLVMSRTVRLHPAVIAVGVVLVGQLFGFVGLFVAVPLLSLLVILTEEVWVKPMEAAAAGAKPGGEAELVQLDDGDDHRRDDADEDDDLHRDPEAGHGLEASRRR